MAQMLMITVKYWFKSLNHFELDQLKVFVDITQSAFNFANVSHGSSGVHWQHTLQMDHVRKHPIYTS